MRFNETIRIKEIDNGFIIATGYEPTSSDPLCQRGKSEFYVPNSEDAGKRIENIINQSTLANRAQSQAR